MGKRYDDERLKWIYRRMTLIREFEERVYRDFLDGKLPGFVHLYAGEEAVAVGVCAHLGDDDFIASTHRGHGHCLAKGVAAKSMMAELHGKATGTCKGKGGSMHIADIRLGMLGANGIVAAGLPLCCGAALAAKLRKSKNVAVAFLGDGASNAGAFHESLNLAAVLKLPVIFVIENNGYADATSIKFAAAVENLSDRAQGYGMPGMTVDGMDVFAVYDAAAEAIARARSDQAPFLLECKTYRYYGHFVGDAMTYRNKAELEQYKNRDCIRAFEKRVVEEGRLTTEVLSQIKDQSTAEIKEAVNFAETSPLPKPEECLEDLLSEPTARETSSLGHVETDTKYPTTELEVVADNRVITYREAINEALSLAMREDPNVFLIGEDEAGGAGCDPSQRDAWGGAFGVTKGLIKEFGPERVIDTPISEAGFVGAAAGAAMAGMRPVADLMYISFIGVCLDQVMNQVAKLRYMSGGNVQMPLTIRTTIGAGMGAAAQHSDSIYSLFVHIPGLKVVAPSTPYDAKGLLLASIRDNDPVIFVENKILYNTKGPVPEQSYTIPLGKADVKKEGKDLTIVAISRMVQEALQAASELDRLGVSAEVIDPRSLWPLDLPAILNSVVKTGRLIIVDEDYPQCGMASEIAAQVSTQVFDYLDCPIQCVTPPRTHVPFSSVLEQFYLPNAEKIIACATNMVTNRERVST